MGFQVSYLLILVCILSGCSAVIITNEEIVYASAGSSVTLNCSILQGKETHVTQIQWSKSADGQSRIIAVYNPLYGTKYTEAAYNNSASFEKGFHDCSTDFNRTSKANNLECNHWVLQLKNVTLELSGSYECIFTTFPTGTSSSKIHLFVKKRDVCSPLDFLFSPRGRHYKQHYCQHKMGNPTLDTLLKKVSFHSISLTANLMGKNEILCVLTIRSIKLEANISDNFTNILEGKGFWTLPKFIPITLTRLNESYYYKNSVLQALLNQSLEIPCVNSMPHYINLTNASVTWSLQKENGTEEILIKKPSYYLQSYTANLTVCKDRIQMGSKNALLISPVTVIDDGKTFVCSIATLSARIQESATQVKIFAKPEISIVFHTDSKGKAHFTCVIKKAYPKPKLKWYMGGKILNEKSQGLLIENKNISRVGNFYEKTSFLSIWNITHSSINQAFKCMSAYHFTTKDRWNFSSKELFIPHGFQNTSLAYSEFISHNPAVSDSPTERLQTTLSEASEVMLVPDSSSEKHLHSTKTLQSDTTTKLFSDSTVPQKILHSTKTLQSSTTTMLLHDSTVPQKSLHSMQPRQNNTITTLFGETTVPQSDSTIPQRNLSIRRMTELTTMNRTDNSYTVKNALNTGSTMVPKHSTFPWPGVVTFLLLFCTCLIICGIRKWCQHRRKIMNKPPSFKPPPPPVKHSSIQVYNEIYSSSDELENLKSA